MTAEERHRQEVDALQRWVIMRMFFAPADETYLLARFSVLAGLHDSFAWLANHAIEKYLKAAILVRGGSIKDKKGKIIAHDTIGLYQLAVKTDDGIKFPEFFYPDDFPITHRWPESLESTLQRFNSDGDSHSRYGIRGYRIFHDDLLKLDRMVFHIRTRCRGKRLVSERDVAGTVEDSIETLHLETFWSIDSGGVLERALNASGRSADLTSFARVANVAFLGETAPGRAAPRSAAGVGAFPDDIFPTAEADADIGIVRAVEEVLKWAQDSIQVPQDLREAMRRALSEIAKRGDYPASLPP